MHFYCQVDIIDESISDAQSMASFAAELVYIISS